jgi:hypothetical protein
MKSIIDHPSYKALKVIYLTNPEIFDIACKRVIAEGVDKTIINTIRSCLLLQCDVLGGK